MAVSRRILDGEALAPRLAAIVFLAAGALGLCADALLPSATVGEEIVPTAVAAVLLGLALFVAPWRDWDRRAQLLIPLSGLLILAAGGLHGDVAGPFLAILPLPFVYVGFTQPRGTSLAVVPAAALALLVAARFDPTPMLVAALVFALPMSVLVGEAIAMVEVRRASAERQLGRLLDAVRFLAAVDDEQIGAHLLASLATELLGADAAAVYLPDSRRTAVYRHRAAAGHPAVIDAAPLVLDRKSEPELLRPGTTTFFADTTTTPALDAPGAGGRVRSAAVIPLPGPDDQPAGIVLVMWGRGMRSISRRARQAADLLAQEAGHLFTRLHERAALARDAETDPLTELANRRTLARALETLRPGDAVVIVDLDHFKRVNDRFGHDVGDRTLRTLARCLRDATRQVDCVARLGGEEFALVLPDAGATGADAALQRVRTNWASTGAVTTFSSGIAVHETGTTPRDTLRRADAALYRAKESGRDRDVLAPATVEITL
jgi:diguanylate cyclase (GGDEF)-like protein